MGLNGISTVFKDSAQLIFYAVNFCPAKCVLTVVNVIMVILVGSVPVSVSPKAFLATDDLKSQIVLISLVSFFDLLFFMAFSFAQNYSAMKPH